ncbi:MAG: hypothetical protein ABI772_11950, partial [Bacteroidota bacterium]
MRLKTIYIACLLAFLFAGEHAFSQYTNKVWCFGDSAGVDFSSGIPTPITTPYRSQGGSSSVCDSNGQLLFYVRSITESGLGAYSALIINRNFQTMDEGDSILGTGFYHEHIIIPSPGMDSMFYIAGTAIAFNFGIRYSIVDLKFNSGFGKVIQKNSLLSNGNFSDAIAVTKHGNGRDWWIVMHKWEPTVGSNQFYIFLLTPSGFSAPTIYSIGVAHKSNIGNLEFTRNGDKFIATNNLGLIELFDFDRCSGVLNNNILISLQSGSAQKRYFGSCFSPNGTVLYVGVADNIFNGDSLRLYQFNLLASNIAASKLTIYNMVVPCSGGMLALGPDDKIYMSGTYAIGYPYPDSVHNIYNENLSVINNPDSIGLACNFQPFSFYLGGN